MNLKQPLESGKDSLKSRLLKMGWQQWATLLLVGLLLVVLALPVSDEGEKKNKTSLLEEEETNSAAKSELETKLEDLLSKVEGVGKVQVLLMTGQEKDPMGFDTGEGTKVQRELTDIENSVIEGVIVRILANMREAWTQVIDLRPRLGQIETNPQFAQIVPPSEMVVLVTLETKVGDEEGMMNFCIPYITIEPIISKLSSQFWFSSVRRSSTTQYLGVLKDKLSTVDMDIVAELGSIVVPVRDVLNLRVGDTIRLSNVKVGDPLTLSVGDQKKFLCQAGVIGKKMAVQILKKLDDSIPEEFEELTTEGEDL